MECTALQTDPIRCVIHVVYLLFGILCPKYDCPDFLQSLRRGRKLVRESETMKEPETGLHAVHRSSENALH